MKRIILLLAFLFPLFAYAQQEHIAFKGIPVTGSLSSFITKMKNIGYTLEHQADNGAIMRGSFAGFSDCTIVFVCTPKTKTVWKVGAILPEQVSWSSVKMRYNDFKERYIAKYGLPEDSYEFFSDSYYEGDGYELQAITLEKAVYATYWKVNNGSISIEIEASSNSKGNVKLSYEDSIGAQIKRQEQSQVVDDDI